LVAVLSIAIPRWVSLVWQFNRATPPKVSLHRRNYGSARSAGGTNFLFGKSSTLFGLSYLLAIAASSPTGILIVRPATITDQIIVRVFWCKSGWNLSTASVNIQLLRIHKFYFHNKSFDTANALWSNPAIPKEGFSSSLR